MPKIQILTEESIEKIERAINTMDDYKVMYPFNALVINLTISIEELKTILTEVKE